MRLAILALVLAIGAGAPGAAQAVWSSSPLPQHSGSEAVACLSTSWCEAVGGWDQKPTAQTVIDRGPAHLRSVACPAVSWCMALGGGIAERWHG